MQIDNIRLGHRYRKDMGNVHALADSIATVGLLHPIVVTPDGELIAGARRLEAAKLLGWEDIPATVIDLDDLIRAEHDENSVRKDFTPSEAVAIGRALEPLEREAAKERSGTRTDLEPPENFTGGNALDRVASTVGMSRPTYSKAKAIVEAAEAEPETFGDLAERMDATGSVHGAYKELKKRTKQIAKATPPPDLPDATDRYRLAVADIREYELEPASVDFIITDPPYPAEYLDLYGALSEKAARWLKPGGVLLVMCGQSYLPEIMYQLEQHMLYHWTLAYLTPGGQAVQLWQRKVNTFWKPVLWFVNGEYDGDWIGDVAKSAVNDNDKRFHGWGQSESGMADLIERFTYPGQTICDPFCGGGTTGVVAVKMDRFFVGIDNDPSCIKTTKERLLCVK